MRVGSNERKIRSLSPESCGSFANAKFDPSIEVRPRKDKRGVDLISDALPFGRLWYDGPNAASNAIGYASQYSRSHDAVIRVYDDAGNVIETHEHKGDFKERERSRFGFRTEQKAATMPPPMSDSHRRWHQMSELIKHAGITSA